MSDEQSKEIISPTVAEDFLSGGGEIGALMRSIQWDNTSLGPISSWPQSLRTSVSICLNSRFAIIVWWGQDLTVLYNDAYKSVLGSKHPWALGEKGEIVWSEVWNVVGPMLQSVISTGTATWSDDLLLLLERYGYQEECYFTFSYSPIRDETGAIVGIFTPVAETTDKVIRERRLNTLRDLAYHCSEARDMEEACAVMGNILGQNPYDHPFTLAYLLYSKSDAAELAWSSGIEVGSEVAQELIDLNTDNSSPWPIKQAIDTVQTVRVEKPANLFADLPIGVWNALPNEALVIPISLPGATKPLAVFIAAVSPLKALDEEYQAYFNLLASQISQTIAEVNAYEEERKRAEAYAELDRAKTAFFSNISHELRTPLTLILGPVQDVLAQHEPALTGESLQTVERNSLRLLRLVNSLLDFSRLEAGKLQPRFVPTDICALTLEIAESFRPAIERAGLSFNVNCTPTDDLINLDREMWEKIVLNLLSNALKFTHSGEVGIRITSDESNVILQVWDTGIGIENSMLSRVFERFYRVDGSSGRTYEGTGIGLALVRELVQLHGGSVRVESEVGSGSRFIVDIPVSHATISDLSHSESNEAVSLSQSVSSFDAESSLWTLPSANSEDKVDDHEIKDFHILIVDDNADMRNYIMRILDGQYRLTAAANGKEALAIASKDTPDLVLSDIMMPEMNGLELLQALRENQSTQTVPIILLSARAGEESKITGLESGADDYLSKPFSSRELRARVATFYQLSQMRKQTEEALNQAYLHEHNIAATLQRAMLAMPPEEAFPGLSINSLYESAQDEADIGGDFLDAFLLTENEVALVIGDVSGKGLAAATHTAEIKYTLRSFLREYSNPASAMIRLNAVLCDSQQLDTEPHDGFVCLSLVTINTLTGEANFSIAGAEAPLIIRATGAVEEVVLRGIPLAINSKSEYRSIQMQLNSGDIVLMVTDGITEARNAKQFYGYESLKAVAARVDSRADLAEISNIILKDVKQFAAGKLRDDACILLARRS